MWIALTHRDFAGSDAERHPQAAAILVDNVASF
jgi:hypothetical protein